MDPTIKFSKEGNLTKNEEYTGNNPGLEGIEAVRLGGVGGDGVEDVNEDKEEGYKKSHPTRNNIRRYNEAYPGHDHK